MRGVLRVALKAMRPFADRHGYDLVVGHGDSGGRPPAWGKVVLLRRLVEIYDRVLWVDADILIVDGSEDLPSLPQDMMQAIVIHRGREDVPGTGVWLLRGGADTARYLDEVWARTDRISHPWWEQAAVHDLLGYVNVDRERADVMNPAGPLERKHPSAWFDRTVELPPEWNVMRWEEDACPVPPRFLHFAAMDNDARMHAMQTRLAQGESRGDEVRRRLRARFP
jgi:hypothetical protein